MNCAFCRKVFYVKRQLDWHVAECQGKHDAASTVANLTFINKPRTRSVTQNLEINQIYSADTVDDEATTIGSSYVDSANTGRHKLVEKYLNERSSLPQEQPQLYHICSESGGSDQRSVITNFTSISQVRPYCTIHPYSELIVPLIYVTEFQCVDCPASYVNITDMMKHEILKHNQNLMFMCYDCRTKFTRKNYLEMHELSHRPYFTCHQCQKKCLTRRELQSHLDQHLQNSFECIKCCRAFLTGAELERHIYDSPHEHNLKNIKTRKFIDATGNHYPISPPIKYRSHDMIQPTYNRQSTTGSDQPINKWLYNGFYENVAAQNVPGE